jgi:ABC-type lipoprotein export system ATPase subunit
MTTCYLYLKLQAGKITVKWKLIEEVLNKVGMGEWQKMPHQLSGGEQQRVAARALLNDPE